MPKFVAVVGGKHSGKTRVIQHLIPELRRRGYRVGSIKEMLRVHSIDAPGKDTWKHSKVGAEIVVATPLNETVVFIKKKLSLNDMLPFFSELEYVVIEGFREEKTIPKIIAAKNAEEAVDFFDGLAIVLSGIIAGLDEEKRKVSSLEIPIVSSENEAEKLADIVEQNVFPKLQGSDCGDCGYNSCYEFAKAILAGKAKPGGCPIMLKEEVILEVDGGRIPLTRPFAQKIIKNTIMGMISSLKGVGKMKEVKIIVRNM